MGTGLIYAMVVGLWALFLLPMWLRNHEREDEGRQVDRFRRAMTQLSQPRVEVVSNTEHKQVTAKRAVLAGEPGPVALTPAARRRRVLGVLTVAQLLGVMASLSGRSALLTLTPTLLIVGFLTLARAQVRRERSFATTPSLEFSTASALTTFARALASARSARRPVARAFDTVGQAPAAPIADAAASWEPVRTPAPSYVSAPAATAIPRAIDTHGGWTGSAMLEAARAMADQPEYEPVSMPVMAFADPDVTTEIPAIRITA